MLTPAGCRPVGWGRRIAGALLALLLAGGLRAAPAAAQWGPVYDDDPDDAAEHGASDPDLDLGGPAPEAGARPQPADRDAIPVMVGAVGGYWGLGRPEGQGLSPALGWGLRAGAEPWPWLPVEVWHVRAGRDAGTPVVSSGSGYAATLLLLGWQYARGPARYGISAGGAATFHWVTHRVSELGSESLSASGWSLGPAVSGVMRWRFGMFDVRVEVTGLWRGTQADLLATTGFGLCFPGQGE